MMSRVQKHEESDSHDSEGSPTKKDERKKKAGFEVGGVPLHYTRKVGNILTSIFSRRAYHFNVCEEHVHFWRKDSS